MPRIHVHTPFALTLDDSRQRSFPVGEHEVDESVAEHWYVRAHSEPETEAPAAPEPEPSATKKKQK